MKIETVTCSKCGDKKPLQPRNNILYPPKGWKRYSGTVNGAARPDDLTKKFFLCEDCWDKSRKVFSMRWRVVDCISTEHIPNNSFRVSATKAGKPRIYHVAFAKDAPIKEDKLKKWIAQKLHCEATDISSVVPAVELLRYLEPWFRKCFMAANYAVQFLFRQEEMPTSGEDKLVKLNRTEVARALKVRFPNMSHVAESIVGHVLGKNQYRLNRHRVLLGGRNQLLTYKIGYPIPVRDGQWKPVADPQRYLVEIRLSKVDSSSTTKAQAFTVRFADGKNFDSYKSNFKKMDSRLPLSERIVPLNARLVAESKADQPFTRSKLFLAMTVEAPKTVTRRRGGTLYLSTGPSYLVSARVNQRQLWTLSGDQCPKLFYSLKAQLAKLEAGSAHHRHKLSRLSGDYKFEDRTGSVSGAVEVTREKLVRKQRDKVNTLVQQVVARIVGFAERHGGGFDTVVFDDSSKKRWPTEGFPWYAFKQQLGQKLDAANIQFLDKDGNSILSGKDEAKELEPA